MLQEGWSVLSADITKNKKLRLSSISVLRLSVIVISSKRFLILIIIVIVKQPSIVPCFVWSEKEKAECTDTSMTSTSTGTRSRSSSLISIHQSHILWRYADQLRIPGSS